MEIKATTTVKLTHEDVLEAVSNFVNERTGVECDPEDVSVMFNGRPMQPTITVKVHAITPMVAPPTHDFSVSDGCNPVKIAKPFSVGDPVRITDTQSEFSKKHGREKGQDFTE